MQTKALILNKQTVASLVQFAILLTVSIVAPLFHFQPITGPIVNACLFIATALLGVQAGIMLGLLPSLIAWSVGTLPTPLAPMVPFIMASNTIMVVSFAYLKEKHFAAGVIGASVLKFLFLFSTSYIVINLIAQKPELSSASPIAQKAAQMMSWPQLATALLGGIIAFTFLRFYKK
ncbi:MAG: ECF transporter S component [Candidatus Pacebacteria bacterium]|nr:ECF transporter S component [Candidatus Paceibacterota bacterium]